MKAEVCIKCAGKYLTGQYDPIDEENKRRKQGITFEKSKCEFCGEAERTHLLGHLGSGGALINLETGDIVRRFS